MKIVPNKKASGIDLTPPGGYEKSEAVNNYEMSKKSKAQRKKKRKNQAKARKRHR